MCFERRKARRNEWRKHLGRENVSSVLLRSFLWPNGHSGIFSPSLPHLHLHSQSRSPCCQSEQSFLCINLITLYLKPSSSFLLHLGKQPTPPLGLGGPRRGLFPVSELPAPTSTNCFLPIENRTPVPISRSWSFWGGFTLRTLHGIVFSLLGLSSYVLEGSSWKLPDKKAWLPESSYPLPYFIHNT